MSRRVLLVAATTGYQTRTFAAAAQRLNLDLTLATDRCHVLDDPWGDQAVAVRFEHPLASGEALAKLGFDCVAAVGDRPALIAAEAAARLNVPFHPPAAVAASCDKYAARRRFAAAGLPVPEFFRLHLDEDPVPAARGATYPCVLKPLGLSASRGVIRADSPAEFTAAFHRIRTILQTPDLLRLNDSVNGFIQVERYVAGREFAVEGLVSRGHFDALAIFDKPDPLEGPFFEETLYVTPSREPVHVQDRMLDTVRHGLKALGLWHGPVHAEVRWNDSGAWLLEIAARPIGGLCAHALHFQGGVPLEELILRHALGEDVGGLPLEGPASGVLMIPIPKSGIYEGVEGVGEAQQLAGEAIITAVEGQRLLQLPEGASYLGFLFARRDSPEAVEAALRAAHAKLRFRIATALPVAQPALSSQPPL